MGDELLKKVLGCVIGDSIGAVVEFKYRDEVLKRLNGREWVEDMHPFGQWGTHPLGIFSYTNGDPVRSILMAANHRLVDEEGNLIRTRDVDCVAMVAGVLVGAINGIDAFPKDWVDAAISANREVYGFDIAQNARDFYHAVHGKRKE